MVYGRLGHFTGAIMATLAGARARYERDHVFFFSIAIVMAATVVIGFGSNALAGRVDIPRVPFWVHLHGLTFLSWMGLYVFQNWLILKGNVRQHRQLGWIGAGVACLVVLLGAFTSLMAIHLHRQAFFFTPPFFLSLTMLSLLGFGGLTAAAILMRRGTEWHRRLMLCGTLILINPAWGRLLPMPLLGQVAGQWAIFGALMLYAAWAIIHDLRVRGRVHPAYYWGVGAIVAWQVAIQPLAATPLFQGWAAALTA